MPGEKQLCARHQFNLCKFYYFILKCIWVLCLHVCACTIHRWCVWCPWRPEEGSRYSGTKMIDCCEPPVWVLRTEVIPSGRAASAVNHRSISPVQLGTFYVLYMQKRTQCPYSGEKKQNKGLCWLVIILGIKMKRDDHGGHMRPTSDKVDILSELGLS